MPNMYKVRLAALGLTQAGIIHQIRERTQMPVSTVDMSIALSGVGEQNKHKRIRAAVETLLDEAESKKEEKES